MTRPSRWCRRWLPLLAAVVVVAIAADAGAAPTTEVHLVTMGPGETLFTRAGHLAVMVAETEDGRVLDTEVINYGDTDWDNPDLIADFIAGKLEFYATSTGSLRQTVLRYGRDQGRTVYRQRLALSASQVEALVARFEEDVDPETRGYRYHHVEAICTTRVRDLIDEVTGGALRRQLGGVPAGVTVQDDLRWAFSGHPLVALAADLFFGRRHYRPVDRHYALYRPDRMREALQTVMVPDPDGGRDRVPLAGPPVVLGERTGPPSSSSPSRASTWFSLIGALLLTSLLLDAHRRGRPDLRFAGAFAATGALVFGLVGTAITLLSLISGVAELGSNELAITYPPTDLALLWLAIRWFRGRPGTPRAYRVYVGLRLVTAAAALIAGAAGWLVQRPLWLPALGLLFAAGMASLVFREAREGATPEITAESAS